MEQTKSLTTKRILIYIGITFVITYAAEFGIIYPLSNHAGTDLTGVSTIILQLSVSAMMFMPSIGVLLTRLITKEGFRNCYIKPHLKGHMKYYIMAWFLPVLCIALGACLYFLIFPKEFDINLGYLNALYQAQGVEVEHSQLILAAVSQLVSGVLLAPILNIFTCFGEEWGWRGYLLPKMKEKLPMIPMLLVNGVIWGLWHAPLTILGHNYGVDYQGYPFTGIFAMCGFCIVVGIFMSYVTLKTGSCLPAAIAHGSMNGLASAGLLFMPADAAVNPFLGPAPTGIIGGAFFILLAVIFSILLIKEQKKDL